MTDRRPSDETITVVIADDDAMVRHALSDLIDDHPGLILLGAAATGLDVAELCGRHCPDLAVVDVAMPSGGTVAVRAILDVCPDAVVVAYTARSDRRTRESLLASGARAVFAKGGTKDLAGELYSIVADGGPLVGEAPC